MIFVSMFLKVIHLSVLLTFRQLGMLGSIQVEVRDESQGCLRVDYVIRFFLAYSEMILSDL